MLDNRILHLARGLLGAGAIAIALLHAQAAAATDFVVKVPAHQHHDFIDTGIDLTAGDQVEFEASGLWVDWFWPCSANGYWAGFFYAIGQPPRLKDDRRYFRLLGRIADPNLEDGLDTPLQSPDGPDPSATFVIGKALDLSAKRTGRLYVFVNDQRHQYWNNWGAITLHVHVQRGPQG